MQSLMLQERYLTTSCGILQLGTNAALYEANDLQLGCAGLCLGRGQGTL